MSGRAHTREAETRFTKCNSFASSKYWFCHCSIDFALTKFKAENARLRYLRISFEQPSQAAHGMECAFRGRKWIARDNSIESSPRLDALAMNRLARRWSDSSRCWLIFNVRWADVVGGKWSRDAAHITQQYQKSLSPAWDAHRAHGILRSVKALAYAFIDEKKKRKNAKAAVSDTPTYCCRYWLVRQTERETKRTE